MTARRYRRRPAEVEAWHYDGDNAAEIAEWASGTVVDGALRLPSSIVTPQPGDWIVRSVLPGGLSEAYVIKDGIFSWCYGSVVEAPRRHRSVD